MNQAYGIMGSDAVYFGSGQWNFEKLRLPFVALNRVFQKEFYNFESLYKIIQRTCTYFDLSLCNKEHRVLYGIAVV
jgi:hypothetical protein